MNTRSLRFHLVVWYSGLLTMVFVSLGALMFLQLKNSLENSLLASQSRRARQIAETLLNNVKKTGEPYVVTETRDLYAPEINNRFIRITRKDGTVLYVSGAPKEQSFDPAEVPSASSGTDREFARKQKLSDGRALLIAAFRTVPDEGNSYLVEVGAPTQSIDVMLDRLLLLLLFGLPVVVVVTAAGGYFLVQRALAPVDKIAGKAELITQHNLSERLPVPRTGDELERLSVSLNHMITRLDDAFQNSKRFVADASHELRTPLTILRGELENLAEDVRLSSNYREQIASLLEEVERLSKIVERLFTLSRLDAGEAQTEWVTFDLAELATSTADQMTLFAVDKHIAITYDSMTPVSVKGDPARIKQVVVNLLDNAIKYTPEGGAVHLKADVLSTHAFLEVSDTGIGIPPEAVPHVFDRFYRVDQTRSSESGGAGLGLAIVKSICSAHGGEVEVESAVGRGSRFRVKLPLANGRSLISESNYETHKKSPVIAQQI